MLTYTMPQISREPLTRDRRNELDLPENVTTLYPQAGPVRQDGMAFNVYQQTYTPAGERNPVTRLIVVNCDTGLVHDVMSGSIREMEGSA